MKNLLWITDPHIGHIREPEGFMEGLEALKADMLVVTGDISEASSLQSHLLLLSQVAPEMYYVLGNHDYYGDTFSGVRAQQGQDWLPNAGILFLNETTCLLGYDGWYDGRYGDYYGLGSAWHLADFDLIAELRDARTPSARLRVMRYFADQDAARAAECVKRAIGLGYSHIYFATHVPPFAGAAWHNGKTSDDGALPFFSSKAMGEVLLDAMGEFPDARMTVLCGHSHSPGTYQAAHNVQVLTGRANYGEILVAGTFEY